MTGQLLKVNNPTSVLKLWWTLWDRLLLTTSWRLLPTFTPVCSGIIYVSFVSYFYVIIIIMKEEAKTNNCIITFGVVIIAYLWSLRKLLLILPCPAVCG